MEIRLKTAEEFHSAHVTIEIRATPEEASVVSERLFTSEEVGHYQATEAELVGAPLRRRVTELEAELERYRRAHVCTDRCQPQAHVAMTGRKLVADLETKLAESRELVDFKTRVADQLDEDRAKLHDKVREFKAEADKAQEENHRLTYRVAELDRDRRTEKTRADKAQARVAELEKALAISIDRENRLETQGAEEAASYRRSVAARDSLLAAATGRSIHARELLAADEVTEARDGIVTTKGAILATAISAAIRVLDKA